jgi:gliding motility-associated-like protein
MNYKWTVAGNHTVGGDGDLEGEQITITLNGPVTINVTATNGACTGTATTTLVNPTTAPKAPDTILGPAEVCANSTGNVYSVEEVPGASTYKWEVPTGWTFTGQGTRSITVTANATGGQIRVGVANTCFPDFVMSAPKTVAISTLPSTASITDNSTLCEGLSYSVTSVTGATTYRWTVPTGYTIVSGEGTTSIKVKRDNNTATGNVTVTPSNALGCSGSTTSLAINTTILNGDLNFPKAFSPNNDGNNDTWVIANLEKYAENEVVIFNRYGSEVYKKKNYQNDWTGNGLSQGTYFYKVRVKFCDGVTKEFTGYTSIFR